MEHRKMARLPQACYDCIAVRLLGALDKAIANGLRKDWQFSRIHEAGELLHNQRQFRDAQMRGLV